MHNKVITVLNNLTFDDCTDAKVAFTSLEDFFDNCQDKAMKEDLGAKMDNLISTFGESIVIHAIVCKLM